MCVIPAADYWVVILWALGMFNVFLLQERYEEFREEIRGRLIERAQLIPFKHGPEHFVDTLIAIVQIVLMIIWPIPTAIFLGERFAHMTKMFGDKQ